MHKELSMTVRVGLVLGTAFLLSACATGGAGLGSSLSPQTISAPSTQPLPPVAPLAPPPQMGTLIGLDGHGLRNEFGTPSFQRSEPGAEVWRYDGKTCALFVYLYEDNAMVLRTAFIEARADIGGEVPTPPCVAEISHNHQLSAQRH